MQTSQTEGFEHANGSTALKIAKSSFAPPGSFQQTACDLRLLFKWDTLSNEVP
jgi:hypothetical protein